MAPIIDFNPREYGVDVYAPGADNPMGCSQSGLFRLKLDAQNYEVLAAFLLSQYAQNKSIRIYTAQCDGDGASLIVAVKST